jgi:predicted component of type VI protein secretion system
MEVKLRVLEGTNAGQEILLPVKKFFIGRAEECHLRPQSDLISRDHCAIVVEDSQVWVNDFGSKNGTFVNGERVRREAPLKNGDRLRVGPLEFEVLLSTSVGGAKRPPVRDLKEAVARVAQSASGTSLPVDQWLGDTAPAAPSPPNSQATSDTGQFSGDTGRVSPNLTVASGSSVAPAGVAPAIPTSVPPPSEVSSATIPISASSTDTVAVRGPIVVPPAAAQAPPPAAPAEAKSGSSIYNRMAGAGPAAPAEAAAPAAPAKPRQAPSVYVPPPPEAKVEAESAEKDAVPPPHQGKLPKSSTANSRDAAADTLRRLFGRR